VRATACLALVALTSFAPQRPAPRAASDAIRESTDVAWLEQIASSAPFAETLQGTSRIGAAKSLRIAAYARLGAIGTPESLAAAERVDRDLAETSLTPSTVALTAWPSAAWHMTDAAPMMIARTAAADGTTYGVIGASLLGGLDLFLVSSRTPDDPRSWSRPKLVGPIPARTRLRDASLAFEGVSTLVLRASGVERQFALEDIERDSDGDGWTDLEEGRIGTNPHAADTDGDGIPDGRDVCPLFPRPPAAAGDDSMVILQRAIFAAFALTGSRELLYVTPSTPRVHVTGYGGPIVFDRAIPGAGGTGGVYVSWKIRDQTETDAVVQITDWEDVLAAGGQDVFLKRIQGKWVVVAVKTTWVS
jgi:hypothetical protein